MVELTMKQRQVLHAMTLNITPVTAPETQQGERLHCSYCKASGDESSRIDWNVYVVWRDDENSKTTSGDYSCTHHLEARVRAYEELVLTKRLKFEKLNQKYYTDDGVEITPGLRVFTNDWSWYVVGSKQFTERDDNGEPYLNNPGGQYFDGWFRCWPEGTSESEGNGTIYNGERMTTREPHHYTY